MQTQSLRGYTKYKIAAALLTGNSVFNGSACGSVRSQPSFERRAVSLGQKCRTAGAWAEKRWWSIQAACVM
jgi:hypothetical protein